MKAFSLNISQNLFFRSTEEKVVKQQKNNAAEKAEVRSSAETDMDFMRWAYTGNFFAGAHCIFHPLLFKPQSGKGK
jgi:hypothetical protein